MNASEASQSRLNYTLDCALSGRQRHVMIGFALGRNAIAAFIRQTAKFETDDQMLDTVVGSAIDVFTAGNDIGREPDQSAFVQQLGDLGPAPHRPSTCRPEAPRVRASASGCSLHTMAAGMGLVEAVAQPRLGALVGDRCAVEDQGRHFAPVSMRSAGEVGPLALHLGVDAGHRGVDERLNDCDVTSSSSLSSAVSLVNVKAICIQRRQATFCPTRIDPGRGAPGP
jgi:hypothetical protein